MSIAEPLAAAAKPLPRKNNVSPVVSTGFLPNASDSGSHNGMEIAPASRYDEPAQEYSVEVNARSLEMEGNATPMMTESIDTSAPPRQMDAMTMTTWSLL